MQLEVEVAAFVDDVLVVVIQALTFRFTDSRTVLQQAAQQEQVQEIHLGRIQAKGRERVQVQAANLDVFHAALTQGLDRLFPSPRGAFGPHGAVILVLNLENTGIELDKLVTPSGTDLFVGRPGSTNGPLQRVGVGGQFVKADIQG